jgi:hypothetical protein
MLALVAVVGAGIAVAELVAAAAVAQGDCRGDIGRLVCGSVVCCGCVVDGGFFVVGVLVDLGVLILALAGTVGS